MTANIKVPTLVLLALLLKNENSRLVYDEEQPEAAKILLCSFCNAYVHKDLLGVAHMDCQQLVLLANLALLAHTHTISTTAVPPPHTPLSLLDW